MDYKNMVGTTVEAVTCNGKQRIIARVIDVVDVASDEWEPWPHEPVEARHTKPNTWYAYWLDNKIDGNGNPTVPVPRLIFLTPPEGPDKEHKSYAYHMNRQATGVYLHLPSNRPKPPCFVSVKADAPVWEMTLAQVVEYMAGNRPFGDVPK